MAIVALSGVGNTGKTTAQNFLKQHLEDKGHNVKVYEEIAREMFALIGEKGVTAFQKAINEKEIERIEEIKNNTDKYDYQIVDRTTADNWAYFEFNKMLGHIATNETIQKHAEQIYDVVLLFTEPIKETKTAEFTAYNDERLSDMMKQTVQDTYGENVVPLQNWKEDKDAVVKIIDTL